MDARIQKAQHKYLNKRFTNNDGHSGFVLRYVNAFEVHFQFDSGYVGCFAIGKIRNGKFRDKMQPSVFGIGFFGDGEYKSKENGKHTKVYAAWNSMLKRCYDEKYQARRPTYIGCSVAPEWHDFQCFAEWYYKNYPADGKDYQLDKDHLVKGNKLYGPDTCCFLTPQQNTETSQAKHYKFTSPNGESIDVFNLSKFCRENRLSQGHMSAVALGRLNHHNGWKLCQY
jgi:hypothetical protein